MTKETIENGKKKKTNFEYLYMCFHPYLSTFLIGYLSQLLIVALGGREREREGRKAGISINGKSYHFRHEATKPQSSG